MHPQRTAVFALTLVAIMCSTPAKSTEATGNPFPSAEPTQTAAVFSAGSVQTPKVLKLRGFCSGKDKEFCLNGHCRYLAELNKPTCRCPPNYIGERCEHMVLDSHADGNREKLIAISGGVALLLCSIIAALYCCLKKRCEREKPSAICHSALAV